ncbi:MAG: phenylalanine--tRNA ligase subunit alpha [Myxococcales bacterium]|nr:phenylalanine--tRNA ligase subunit alpha [Myxococcales bacterium]
MERLLAVRSQYLGPKGELTLLLRTVGQLPPEQRRTAGAETNKRKAALEADLQAVLAEREAAAREAELRKSQQDLTLPGRLNRPLGRIHPIQRIIQEVKDIFAQMGFVAETGPEVELDLYNFAKLNFAEDHPARDMQDTFFVSPPGSAVDGAENCVRLLRTHTSPVQVRVMEHRGAPIRIISAGRVYRCDADATHSPMFHQIEGLWVDEGVSFAHLKGVLGRFVSALFGDRAIRLRPSFFPFVEPGVELDIQCVFCAGEGCRVCKQTGWMEVLGAGMVHPNVLDASGVDSERYTGFAFGLGVDRLAMLRYQIDDIAHLYRGDARFLSQL